MTSSNATPISNYEDSHTSASASKPTTAFSAITDPDFHPTLDEAPTTEHAKSNLLISLIVGSGLLAHVLGFELFQVSEHSSWGEVVLGVGTGLLAIAMALYWTGSYYIDWWKLVLDYWWLSMPVAGAAGLLLVMAQEQSSDWNEVD